MGNPLLKNRVATYAAGTSNKGPIRLGSSIDGYKSVSDSYGSDATLDLLIIDVEDWEVARDCSYTYATNTVTRGTFEDSSTGSILDLSSNAQVYVTKTAARVPIYATDASGNFTGLVNPSGSLITGSNMGTPATGFARFQPGFAASNSRIVVVHGSLPIAQHGTDVRNFTLGTAIAFAPNTPPPSTARALLLYVDCKTEAGGSAGTHELNLAFYWDHAGTQQWFDTAMTCYEPSGIASGTWIGGGAPTCIAPITGSNLEITLKFNDTWGSGSTSEIQGISILGYYD